MFWNLNDPFGEIIGYASWQRTHHDNVSKLKQDCVSEELLSDFVRWAMLVDSFFVPFAKICDAKLADHNDDQTGSATARMCVTTDYPLLLLRLHNMVVAT